MTDKSDRSEDPNDEVQYHVEVGEDDVADAVLLPGNPERVDNKITALWDGHEEVAHHREYRTATGTYEDAPISVTSTGIGSPSAAIAVEELARVGVDTFIRVGSCGAIQPGMDVGDLVITTGAVRQEGTSDEYVREDYPAAADGEVVSALVAAAERLGYDYHTGVTMSADSFYAGQGRPGFEGFEAAGSDELVAELQDANVKNIEMEASAILTIANVYGSARARSARSTPTGSPASSAPRGVAGGRDREPRRDPPRTDGRGQTRGGRRSLARRPLAVGGRSVGPSERPRDGWPIGASTTFQSDFTRGPRSYTHEYTGRRRRFRVRRCRGSEGVRRRGWRG